MALAAGSLVQPRELEAATVHGAVVIDNAVQISAERFRAPKDKDWDKVVQFYRSAYGKKPGIVFRHIASTPKVKAMHIQNTKRGSSWEGINLYQTGGDIFVYVIPAATKTGAGEKEPG